VFVAYEMPSDQVSCSHHKFVLFSDLLICLHLGSVHNFVIFLSSQVCGWHVFWYVLQCLCQITSISSFIIIIRFCICTIASPDTPPPHSTVDPITNTDTNPIPRSNRHPSVYALCHANYRTPHRRTSSSSWQVRWGYDTLWAITQTWLILCSFVH
jgi:hypothetical protein